MALSAAQYTTLKTDILANTDPLIVQALINGANNVIRDFYNGNAQPDYWIYRSDPISPEDIGAAIELDDVANMTTGDVEKMRAFFDLRPAGFRGDNATDRAGFADVLSAAAANDSDAAVAALWQRLATRAEYVFRLSTGTGQQANADTTSWQGQLSSQDVVNALNA